VTGSLETYLPLLDELAGMAHLYALDWRGHGLSSHAHAPEEYRVQDYGQDLQLFLQTVVGEPATLAGHSLGGLVATWTAAQAQAGSAIRGMLLEDPPMYRGLMPAVKTTPFYPAFVALKRDLQRHLESGDSSEAWADEVAAWPYDEGRTTLEALGLEGVRLRAWQLHQLDPFVLDAVIDGTLTVDFIPDDLLSRITCPVHLLAGRYELGGAMTEADVQQVISLLPQGEATTWSDAGHRLHQDKPEEYIEVLKAFYHYLVP
jgi:pimeloyl-ACP methyl ester carboxylesterase